MRGGTIVVLLSSSPLTNNNNEGPVKIGKFAIDPTTLTTYELQLTLDTDAWDSPAMWVTNMVRKLQGRTRSVLVGPEFVIKKKKLYRD